MIHLLEGVTPYKKKDINLYFQNKWWRGLTLSDLLDRAADMHPDQEAFVDRYSRLSFGHARKKVNQLAAGLLSLGLQPLERVMIQLPNWNEFVIAYFACQKIGVITVLLIDRYRPYEINRLAKMTGATAWIVSAQYKKVDFGPIIGAVQKKTPAIRHIITVRGEIDLPNCHPIEKITVPADLTPEQNQALQQRKPDPMQVCHMGPTGGTTGAPKIVPRIHNSLICGIESCAMSWGQHCEDINLIAGPIGHDLSFTKGLMGSILTQGKTILLDTTDIRTICETIEKERVSAIIWVPTLAQKLVAFEALDQFDLTCLKKMHSAGGASHRELVQQVMEKLKMRFYNGYGGTEGMTCITRKVDDYETICCTVGRPTFPYDIYKVVDVQGTQLPSNTPGELLVKGPCIFSGYYNNPEENALTFDGEGFFRTGDVAKIDENGYITLVGRIKEMINRGGESISATEIEHLINKHPDVDVVAVIPMSDPLMGERACAYIEPRKDVSLTFEDIIHFLKSQNASVLQLPERIEFVSAMPYTAAQKLDKQALRKDIERKRQQDHLAAIR